MNDVAMQNVRNNIEIFLSKVTQDENQKWQKNASIIHGGIFS